MDAAKPPTYLSPVNLHRSVRLLAWSGFALAAASAFLGACGGGEPAPEPFPTLVEGHEGYIGPEACASCHQQEYDDWRQSHHYQAMLPASDSTVLGDFNNATFTADGVTTTFLRQGDRYIIRTQGRSGIVEDFEVKYTFGFTPLQQYLVEAPGGRMQVPRVSWDTKQRTWFHQYPGQEIHHRDWMHWTGAAQNWNSMCATCHSTDLKRNFDEATDSYRTSYAHHTVTCESCHGPGQQHARFMAGEDYAKGERVAGSHLLLHKGLDNAALMATCARCHARRSELSDGPLASLEVLDNFVPALPAPELYHADGQMLDEVYTHGSFAQSKMFRRGVKCTNCHQPHTGGLLFTGNALCAQCHAPEQYDVEAHSHHATTAGTPSCVDCHMPTVTYMGNDVRHDHSFRVPRPDQSVRYGTPNTCTQCHSDRSAQWATDAVVRWYGPERAPHFSDRLLAGGQPDARALQALLELLADTATPAIIRATALHHMDALPERRSFDALIASLKDRDAQVRLQAIMGLSAYPASYWSAAVMPLLKDGVRAVRIEAVRALATLPPDQFDRNGAPGFSKANDELLAMLRTQSDMTTGALARADLAMRTGDAAQAERQYLRALHMDSLANYARLNLATLYNAQGRNAEAESVLRQALAIDAANARIPALLALLLAELQRPDEALAFFEQAEALGTTDERVYVNHSALLQQQGDMAGARAVLDRGLKRFPNSADLLAETAGLLVRQGRAREATAYVQRLRNAAPEDPRAVQLQSYLDGRAPR